MTISIFLFYLILSRKKKEQADNFKINNDILENVNIFKYKYLALDVKIINIYYELRFIKNYNLTSFNDSLKFINNLLKIYYICKKKMLSKNRIKNTSLIYNKISNAILYQKKALDSLSSITINLPINTFVKDKPLTIILEENIKKLFILSEIKIKEINKLYNLLYKNIENINKETNFIKLDEPSPNPINSYGYLENYNLY